MDVIYECDTHNYCAPAPCGLCELEAMARKALSAPEPTVYDGIIGMPRILDRSGVSVTHSFTVGTATPTSALDIQEGGDHYRTMAIQPVEFIHANNIPFIEGNVIKYVSRWRSKNGIADLKKARHFLDLLIELEDKNHAS